MNFSTLIGAYFYSKQQLIFHETIAVGEIQGIIKYLDRMEFNGE